MGRDRLLERREASSGSTVPRHLVLATALLAGCLAAQAFAPTGHPQVTGRPGQLPTAAAAFTQPVTATAATRTPATRTTKKTTAGSTSTDATTSSDPTTDLPLRSGTGRRVVYSISMQRVWIVGEQGRVQRTYLVSGRLSQPGPGRYHVYSRARWTVSSVSAETMQYMVRFAHGSRTGSPIGFHTIPRNYSGHPAQSVADLGKPLSAGCIRQRTRDAEALWHFAHVGSTVVVTA